MTVDDRVDLGAAVDVRDAADRADTEPLIEYACHEGNYAMTNILSGARAEERAVEQDAKKGITRAPRAIPTDEER